MLTITIKDESLVDAILERRGTDPIFDRLADLIDHGYHYGSPVHDNNYVPIFPRPSGLAVDIPATVVCHDCHATYYADSLHLCSGTIRE